MRKLSLKETAELLKAPLNTLIFCHRNPDPDTLGSAFAIKHILEHLGSTVRIACCDEASSKFSFITGGVSLKAPFDIEDYQRVIAIDVGSASQMGDYDIYADRVTINIDHHEMNTRFCDYYENFTPACAMIVYQLANELGVSDKLEAHFFECVYAGISGDTGCFKYSNTSPEALVCASEIVKKGIDFAHINYIIFDCKTPSELSAQKMALEHTKIYLDGRLAILLVTNEMKAQYGIGDDDISDIISTVRTIQGVLVAVTIKETATPNKLSVSSRANADINVADLCVRLGGGGHPRAAGATVVGISTDEAYELIKNTFAEGIYGYKG